MSSRAADVLIVGGGIMGVSTALALAEAGAGRVTLLERRFLAAGSSGKSGAILRQHYSHDVTIRMARESLAWYAGFRERTGRDIGFRNPGMIFITRTADRAALEGNVALQQSAGVDTRIVDAAGLAELEPRGRYDGDLLAAWEPEAGYVEPLAAVTAIAAEATARGVDIRIGAEVTELVRDGERATGVRTADGTEHGAGVVVVAGGPWTARLLDQAGITGLPLSVIRPEQAFFAPPLDGRDDLPVFGDLVTGAYWKPEPKGWTRVGMMSYEGDDPVPDPDDYDEGITDAFIRDARRRVADRVPAFREAVSWGGCAALYTVTPDAHALIGPVPGIEGVLVVAGFSGHGFKMGPSVGRGVAALITGGDGGAFDPVFFAPDRFLRGDAITTSYTYGILG